MPVSISTGCSYCSLGSFVITCQTDHMLTGPRPTHSFCHVCRHIPDQAVVDMNDRTQDALDTAVAAAVQSICRLMLQMDMLVVQIASYHV